VRGVGNMMSLIEEEIVRRAEVGKSGGDEQSLEEFKPQELSNTLWALATVGRDNQDVFACLEEEILGRGIENFASQDISNSVWAFVTAGQAVPGLLEAVSAGIDARGASAFKNQELTNIVWAYAKVRSPGGPSVSRIIYLDLVMFCVRETEGRVESTRSSNNHHL